MSKNKSNEFDPDRPQPNEMLTTSLFMQTGNLASVEEVFQLFVVLDHLKRENPALLTTLREACMTNRVIEDPEAITLLEPAGVTNHKGFIELRERNIILATVRGIRGREVLENPFLDMSGHTLLDYLFNATLVSMGFSEEEQKAIHENETVKDMIGAKASDSWAGYVGQRKAPGFGSPGSN